MIQNEHKNQMCFYIPTMANLEKNIKKRISFTIILKRIKYGTLAEVEKSILKMNF